MQKVHLLRNDLKLGPFTLPELWQQSLRPGDRFWIEGKSTSWSTLESLELSPSTDNTYSPETAPDLESKAEAIRRRAMEVPPRVFTRMANEQDVSRPEGEEESILLIDHREPRSNVLGEVLMTVFIVALLGGGLLGGRSLFSPKATASAASITRISSRDEHAAAANNSHPTVTAVPAAVPVAPDTAVALPIPVAVHKPILKKTVTALSTAQTNTARSDSEKTAIKIQEASPARMEEKPQPASTASSGNSDKNDATTAAVTETAEPQKKKGLGQAIKNLFRSKKKREEAAVENNQP